MDYVDSDYDVDVDVDLDDVEVGDNYDDLPETESPKLDHDSPCEVIKKLIV